MKFTLDRRTPRVNNFLRFCSGTRKPAAATNATLRLKPQDGWFFNSKIKTNGTRCGSPALNNRRYCFFHHRASDLRRMRLDHPQFRGEFPLLEDANAVQMAIQEVVGAVLQDRIDLRRAGLLLFACQTAASNLKNVNFEPLELRQPEEEKPSEFVRILFDALELDIPGMPPRKKEFPTVADKESTTRTA